MTHYEQVYFIGIGGIGMSAIARYFNRIGKRVSGYDKTPTKLTKQLEKEGIKIHYSAQLEKIPADKSKTLVVYTPAIPSNFDELKYVTEENYTLVKRAKVLGLLANETNCIAIAGTHGKTSVTTMVAHILKQSSKDCGAFLGGIAQNYNSNFLLPETKNENTVVEADEFDRSFLNLTPDFAVITSMDADHLDIYNDHTTLLETFHDFFNQIRKDGTLVYKKGLEIDKQKIDPSVVLYSYAVEEKADYSAINLRIENGFYRYDLHTPETIISDILLTYPGLVNVENSVAAAAIALNNGVKEEEIKKALSNYKGVRRRFDVRFSNDDVTYIDDYAHHPTELDATIKSVRQLFPKEKVTGIFQPHLFSRTQDFYTKFAESLDKLDEVILLDIYPARELPILGVSSKMIIDEMKNGNKNLLSRKEAIESVTKNSGIIMTLGAGDIDTMIDEICSTLENKYVQ